VCDFPRPHFDFVSSIATLHHLNQRELLLKIKDALKPCGVLVILDLVQSSSLSERVMDVVGLGVIGHATCAAQHIINLSGEHLPSLINF